jgi:hypothetical protein
VASNLTINAPDEVVVKKQTFSVFSGETNGIKKRLPTQKNVSVGTRFLK